MTVWRPDKSAVSTEELISEAQAKMENEQAALPPMPEYPVEALIGPLRNLVDSTLLPSAFVAGAGLAALAMLCGAADLYVFDDDVVRPVLWIPLLGLASSIKTPAKNYAFRLLEALEDTAWKAYKDDYEYWKKTKEGGRPSDPTIIINDVTLEKLGRMLEDNPCRGQVHDELSSLILSVGQYKKGGGGDHGKWLSLWSPTGWRYSRVNGDIDYRIARHAVSVTGPLVMSDLHLLGGDADGYRARWFPHAVDGRSKEWAAKNFVPEDWNKAVHNLYELRMAPRDWHLKGSALKMWQDARTRWKKEARGPESEMTTGALEKADQQCVRVSLVIAESLRPGGKSLDAPEDINAIPARAMACAIAITNYVMDVWRALDVPDHYSTSRKDDAEWEAVRKWKAFAASKGGKVSTRELQTAKVGGVRTASQMQDVLGAYREYYPDCIKTGPTGHGGRDITWVYAAPEPGQCRQDRSNVDREER